MNRERIWTKKRLDGCKNHRLKRAVHSKVWVLVQKEIHRLVRWIIENEFEVISVAWPCQSRPVDEQPKRKENHKNPGSTERERGEVETLQKEVTSNSEVDCKVEMCQSGMSINDRTLPSNNQVFLGFKNIPFGLSISIHSSINPSLSARAAFDQGYPEIEAVQSQLLNLLFSCSMFIIQGEYRS